jgi:GTP1/Obg family GTP-binding protein
MRYNSQLKITKLFQKTQKLETNLVNEIINAESLNIKLQDNYCLRIQDYENSAKRLTKLLIFKSRFVKIFEQLSEDLNYLDKVNKNVFCEKLDLSKSYSSVNR